MSRNERQSRIAKLAVDDVKIGAADGAAFDLQKELIGVRPRHRQLGEREGLAGSGEHHGVHRVRVHGVEGLLVARSTGKFVILRLPQR